MVNKSSKSVDIAVMQKEAKNLEGLFKGIDSSRRSFAISHKLNATYIQQHLSCHRPISLDYARKYAAAFNCKLIDISQRLHDEITKSNDFIEQPKQPVLKRESAWSSLILPDGDEYDHQIRDMFKKLTLENREDALQYVQNLLSKQMKHGTPEKPFPDLSPEPKKKPKIGM